MKSKLFFVVAAALLISAGGAFGQIQPGPYFTDFHDTSFSSTFNGELLPVGTIIEAYDPDSVLCGIDTVTMPGAFGFMPVYGDQSETPGVDEGAETGDTIRFVVNGYTATVVSGDPTWADQNQRNVTLDVNTGDVTIALTAISQPGLTLVAPGDTVAMSIEVRNDGSGLDYYGLQVSMTQPEGTNELNEWESIIPDTLVYAESGETVTVDFLIRAPIWPGDTANVVSYTLFSYLDTTVRIEDDVDVYATVTDVNDGFGPALPGSFTLQQNYPNPFNPTTTVAFELSSRSIVSFEVYDILGRQVESRYLGSMAAGEHSLEFDGSNLASGVYLYRLSTETAVQTRKMMLVK
ncbi:T9SS type A sorting domain-containing protein [candidate division GN15 bacterium]|nr:T9SS type A sorting domain-containing protein [candidate division GN15 bacterium]